MRGAPPRETRNTRPAACRWRRRKPLRLGVLTAAVVDALATCLEHEVPENL
jgi:hypothetical protein